MALYLSDEQLAHEKSKMEKRGFKATFIEPEHVGGPALATLLDNIYDSYPKATLEYVQRELGEFAGVISEYQEEYGEDAPLSLLA